MNACDRFREWCQGQLDAGKSAPGASPLENHPETCPACRAFQRELLAVHGALATQVPQPDPPPFERVAPHPGPAKPSGIPWWLLIPLGGALLLVLGWLWKSQANSAAPVSRQDPPPATVAAAGFFTLEVEKTAIFLQPHGQGREQAVPGNTRRPLSDRDVLRADEKGAGALVCLGDSRIAISRQTELQVQGEGLRMKHGEVWVSFRRKGSRFSIQTPTAMIGVRGTEFGVTVEGTGATRVVCREGTVWVTGNAGGGEHVVEGGRQLQISAAGFPGDIKEWSEARALQGAQPGEDWMKKATPVEKTRP